MFEAFYSPPCLYEPAFANATKLLTTPQPPFSANMLLQTF